MRPVCQLSCGNWIGRLRTRDDDEDEHDLNTASPAFTLIELMVVVGIMGIILTIAVPGLYRQLHPNPLQKAVDDIREACKAAREMAVLRGATTSLAIDLKNRSFSVQGASAPGPESGISPEGPAAMSRVADVSSSARSFQLSDRVIIEGLGIN